MKTPEANQVPTPGPRPEMLLPEPVTDRLQRHRRELEARLGQLATRLTTSAEDRIEAVNNFDQKARRAKLMIGAFESEFHQLGGWGQLDGQVVDRAQRIYRCYLDQYVCRDLCREFDQNGCRVGGTDLPDRYHEVPVSYETFLLYGPAVMQSTPGHQHQKEDSEPVCQKRRSLVAQGCLALEVAHDDPQESTRIHIPISLPDELRLRQLRGDLSRCGLLGSWHDGIPPEDEFSAYIPDQDLSANHPVVKRLLQAAAGYMVLEWHKADQLTRLDRDRQAIDGLIDDLSTNS